MVSAVAAIDLAIVRFMMCPCCCGSGVLRKWFVDLLVGELGVGVADGLLLQAFWRDVRVAPKRTLRDVNAQFRDADRRLRDLEFHLTSESRELANEIEKLR
jgi:hypothetical protein